MAQKRIYTIGHSTRSLEDFLNLLKENGIEALADVRRFPGSRRYPHFSKDNLEKALPEEGIEYIHFEELGGRRDIVKGSKNTAWKNDAFRGYADYMETSAFRNAMMELKEIAEEKNLAYMCSEGVWWKCHRSLISDYLKAEGWTVLHILDEKNSEEHPYTKAASIVEGKLSYADPNLLL